MKNILVPVELHSSVDSVLATAHLLGSTFGSYLEGVPLGPDLPDLVAFDMPVSWTVADQNTWKELAEEARRRFEGFMTGRNVAAAAPGTTALSWGWAGDKSASDSQIGAYGRVFDISVVGRPGAERGDARMATAEAALFESGRPVLMAPPVAPATMGETIVIAWNQSTETARAVAFAMPLLRKAKRIIVLSIENEGVEGPSGEQLAARLAMHGLPVEAVSKSGKTRSYGEAILDFAGSFGCDLMIKGAYTQSRLRQMIFGGATSHILSKAQMPVFMAN